MLIFSILLVVCGAISAQLAQRPFVGLFLGLAFGPFGILLVVALNQLEEPRK